MAYKINESFFSKIDTEEKSYFLGLLYADGNHYITKAGTGRQITLELNSDDIEIIEKFKKALECEIPIKNRKHGKVGKYQIRDTSGLIICNKRMSEDLLGKGLVPRKSLILTFPDLNIVGQPLLSHFIRGYFDGDGCISVVQAEKRRHTKACFVGSDKFIVALNCILNNAGITLKVYRSQKRKITEIYCQSKSELLKLKYFLYKDSSVFLRRKKNKFDSV